MPEGRPAIPTDIERAVKMEAGYRCAIPSCQQSPIEIAHIEPYSKVLEHRFENLIALCPNCHAKNTKGDIDKKALQIYKSNLQVINGRYTQVEMRLLRRLLSAERHSTTVMHFMDLLFDGLLSDGLITAQPYQITASKMRHTSSSLLSDQTEFEIELIDYTELRLSDRGLEFARNWSEGREVH